MDNRILIVDDKFGLSQKLSAYNVVTTSLSESKDILIKEKNYNLVIIPDNDKICEEFLHFKNQNKLHYAIVAVDDKNKIDDYNLEIDDYIIMPNDEDKLVYIVEKALLKSEHYKKIVAKQVDTITGIATKKIFFAQTRQLLDTYPNEKFVFIRFDIDRFYLINIFFGEEEGNRLLSNIGNECTKIVQHCKYGTCGRISADVFCLCLPYHHKTLENKIAYYRRKLKNFNKKYDVVPSLGLYVVSDNSMEVYIMYTFATIATKSIKGKYIDFYAYYNENMGKTLMKEQQIINQMNHALENGEFKVYIQPKYELEHDQLCGGEALVRWIHPKYGMIYPKEYISFFETNGFITKLDMYVWEEVCKLLKKWVEKYNIVQPVSVNISKVDFYNQNIVDILCNLVQKYDLNPKLLQLEITESAFIDNPKIIIEYINQLQRKGFTILMDDFGSGMSSLSILKDTNFNIIKIDRNFFSKSQIEGRSENIIASVVRMARWLGIPVVAEGVETHSQLEFLKEIGCDYAQGYYFSHPLPVNEYELLYFNKFGEYDTKTIVTKFENADAVWAINPQMEFMFSQGLQPVAIYEYDGKDVEVIRANKPYIDLFQYSDENLKAFTPFKGVNEDLKNYILDYFEKAKNSDEILSTDFERQLSSGKRIWINLRLKYIKEIKEKYLFFGSLTNITNQKKIKNELLTYRTAMFSLSKELYTILLVNYSELQPSSTINILKDDYTVYCAENSKQATKFLETRNIDIIILSIDYAIEEAKNFLIQKKEIGHISNIPVIITSNNSTPQFQIAALSLGASDFIIRPYVPAIFKQRVHNTIEAHMRYQSVVKDYVRADNLSKIDGLTGVYNRYTMEQETIRVIDSSMPKDMGAFLICDIDGFKIINDNYGHDEGDRMLKEFAELLKHLTSKTELLGRMGGDEFAVYFSDLLSQERIVNFCTELFKLVKNIKVNGKALSISVGVSIYPQHGTNFKMLYRHADLALYQVKHNGKGNWMTYNNNMAEV